MITIHNWTALLLFLFLISSSSSIFLIFILFHTIVGPPYQLMYVYVVYTGLQCDSVFRILSLSILFSSPASFLVWPPMILRINLFYYSAILYYYHYFIVLMWWLLLLCCYDYYCVFQFIFSIFLGEEYPTLELWTRHSLNLKRTSFLPLLGIN